MRSIIKIIIYIFTPIILFSCTENANDAFIVNNGNEREMLVSASGKIIKYGDRIFPICNYTVFILDSGKDILFNYKIKKKRTLPQSSTLAVFPYNTGIFGIVNYKNNNIIVYNDKLQEQFHLEADWIIDFDINRLMFCKKNKYGLVDLSGKVLLKPEYDSIYSFNRIFYGQNIQRQYSFTFATRFSYVYERDFNPNLIFVKKHHYYGVLSKTGKVILNTVFDKIINYSNNRLIAIRNQQYYLYDSIGNPITMRSYEFIGNKIFNSHSYFSELIYNVPKNYYSSHEYIDFDFNNRARKESEKYIKVKAGNKWGYLDIKGNTLIPIDYEEIAGACNDKFAVKKGKYFKIIDKQSQIIYDNYLLKIICLYSESVLVQNHNKKYYVYDFNLKSKSMEFGKLLALSKDCSILENKRKQYLVNSKGNILKEADTIFFVTDNLVQFKQGLLWGLVDYKGNNIDNIYSENKFIFKNYENKFISSPIYLQGKVGAINSKGKIILPIIYDEYYKNNIDLKRYSFCRVKINGKYGLYSFAKKRMLISPIYDDLGFVSKYYIEGLYGIVSCYKKSENMRYFYSPDFKKIVYSIKMKS